MLPLEGAMRVRTGEMGADALCLSPVDFTGYRTGFFSSAKGEIALFDLVRNFSQWFFGLLRNFVLVGGLKYFAEKSGGTVCLSP